MASPSSKVPPPTGYPEFAVRRETISQFFDPPLARSTFHDFVSKGKNIPVKGIRGFYRLNDSLRRLGLREVPSFPESATQRSIEDNHPPGIDADRPAGLPRTVVAARR